MSVEKILILLPPSPAFQNVMRDYAGGYGIAFNTTRSDYGHEGGCAPYVSALYAAAILEQLNYDVKVIDSQAEQLTADETLGRIKQFQPKLIISTVNLPSLYGDTAFLGMAHGLLVDVDVVAIGTTCKLLYEEVLKENCISAVVRGDVEVIIPKLVPAILEGADLSSIPGIAYKDQNSTICVTQDAEPLKDLNDLPMIPYHKLPVDLYWEPSWGQNVRYMAILDGRGCPHACRSYCPYPFGFGKRLLLRNPELVIDEVQYLHEKFGTEAFIFRNQTFTMNRKHAEGICNEILRRKLSVRWLCETRLDSVDKEILKLMKSAGCERVHYGLESGDPELFNSLGKPGCDLDTFKLMIDETKKAGMTAKINVVIGLPGESWKTVRNTIKTIRNMKPDAVMSAIITPYPGTRIFDDAKQEGLLLTEDWSMFTGFNPVMHTMYLTSKDLLKAQKMVSDCLFRKPIPIRVLRKAFMLVGRIVKNIK